MSDEPTPKEQRSPNNKLLQILLCVIVLGAAAGILAVIFSTEPEAVRETATKRSAMLVDQVSVSSGNYRPLLRAMGTVRAAREVMLHPQVAGEVLELSEAFEPGGFVEKGDLLLRVDSVDYEVALLRAKARLTQAKADLQVEQGRQEVARLDFEQMDGEISPEQKALILRTPQLDMMKAEVEAAEADVRQAEIDLSRTTLTAPFDAHILAREVNPGSRISPSTMIGHLVDAREYWVEVPVSQHVTARLDIPSGDLGDDEVVIRSDTAWPAGTERMGRVSRLVGALDTATRRANVLVTVKNPLALNQPEQPRLMLGAYVTADIPLRELQGVVRINRDLVKKNQTVWVNNEGKLDIRSVTVAYQDPEYAYISEGLEDGEFVITSRLASVRPGAELRTGPEAEETAQ